MGLLFLIILLVLLMGAIPAWPYSRRWGYGPSGTVGLLRVVLLIMLLFGGMPWTTWTY